MKKFLLSLALLLALTIPFAATACDNTDAKPSALRYEETEDGLRVLGLEEGCTDTTVVIPEKHDGKP